MGITYEVHVEGPVFESGVPEAIIHEYCHNLEERLGDMGVSWIKAYLPTVYEYLKNPGSLGWHKTNHFIPGLYESVIHKVDAEDSVLIHDTPCVYGPWLEGVGSRNPVTRFKGYHTFRLIAQRLDMVATDIAYAELPRYITELNS